MSKLNFPNLLNARDLGGYPTEDGAQTRWKSLVRSDCPARLTPEGMQAMRDYGIRTTIDLRFPSELTLAPNPLASLDSDTRYLHCSLLGESWESWQTRRPVEDGTHYYTAFLDVSQPEMRQVMLHIAGAPAGGAANGVLFHCAAGKDRTGVVTLLLLALAGVRDEVIVDDYMLSAENLRQANEAYLSGFSDPAQRAAIIEDQRTKSAFAAHTLSHLRRRYGGAMGYLQTIGLSANQIERLRQKLRD